MYTTGVPHHDSRTTSITLTVLPCHSLESSIVCIVCSDVFIIILYTLNAYSGYRRNHRTMYIRCTCKHTNKLHVYQCAQREKLQIDNNNYIHYYLRRSLKSKFNLLNDRLVLVRTSTRRCISISIQLKFGS